MDDVLLFAPAIGLDWDYRRDAKAKKDVIDLAGGAHSVKSGRKKWQILIYGRGCFLADDGFQALNWCQLALGPLYRRFPASLQRL